MLNSPFNLKLTIRPYTHNGKRVEKYENTQTLCANEFRCLSGEKHLSCVIPTTKQLNISPMTY